MSEAILWACYLGSVILCGWLVWDALRHESPRVRSGILALLAVLLLAGCGGAGVETLAGQR